MKKFGILCFAIMLYGAASANAQSILDKVDRTLNKADNASNQADRAGNTASRASKMGSKISGLFGKKKNAADAGAENKTVVNITGVDLHALRGIAETAENTKNVGSAKMKYSSSGSTITVQHNGTTDDLLKALQKINPTVFAEKNIEGIEDGQISVKVKNK